MEKTLTTLAELEGEAARFARAVAPAERGATLVTLSGELGAGKTAFTKAVAKALGIEETVTSPTFVIEKIYPLQSCRSRTSTKTCRSSTSTDFSRLVHIDAYRLEQGADLAPLGFDELMRDPANLIFLEWPEMVADALPPAAVRITLSPNPDGSRTFTYGE